MRGQDGKLDGNLILLQPQRDRQDEIREVCSNLARKKGPSRANLTMKTVDLSFASGASGMRGTSGSDVEDLACRPPSTRRGARMTLVRQANSLNIFEKKIK